ncbi:MAG TPA: hypothetical protein VLS45_06480 [Methylomicrobium sp.]|nr:hypothetical protein [Methylomicrobium sp.]
MTAQTRTTVKSYFNAGDMPTEAQFVDLIDSYLSLADTGAQVVTSNLTLGTVEVSSFSGAGSASFNTVSAQKVNTSSISVVATSQTVNLIATNAISVGTVAIPVTAGSVNITGVYQRNSTSLPLQRMWISVTAGLGASTTLKVPHTLGEMPKLAYMVMNVDNAAHSYPAGRRIIRMPGGDGATADNRGVAISYNAATVNAITAVNGLIVFSNTTGTGPAVVNSATGWSYNVVLIA